MEILQKVVKQMQDKLAKLESMNPAYSKTPRANLARAVIQKTIFEEHMKLRIALSPHSSDAFAPHEEDVNDTSDSSIMVTAESEDDEKEEGEMEAV